MFSIFVLRGLLAAEPRAALSIYNFFGIVLTERGLSNYD